MKLSFYCIWICFSQKVCKIDSKNFAKHLPEIAKHCKLFGKHLCSDQFFVSFQTKYVRLAKNFTNKRKTKVSKLPVNVSLKKRGHN